MLELYVFISTDSIYDVCDPNIRSGPVKETDDLRPHSESIIKKLADDEDYGHDKLKCEEYLRNHVSEISSGFPFVCLRLPDVIGPYDSTCRFWAYMLSIQEMREKPLHTQRGLKDDIPLSFIYSKDVASLVVNFLEKIELSKESKITLQRTIHGQSYNIAFDATLRLDEILQKIVRDL